MAWGFRNRPITTLTSILLALGMSACVVQETGAPARAVQVMAPPPTAMQEQPTARPDPSSSWIAGYWHWAGEKYVWIPGHWEKPPPGSSWSTPRYSIRGGTHYYEPGAWVNRGSR